MAPGDFQLTLHAVHALASWTHIVIPPSLTPRQLLASTLRLVDTIITDTQNALLAEVGEGVGAEQMYATAAAALEMAALQSGDANLLAVFNRTINELAIHRVSLLHASITARLNDEYVLRLPGSNMFEHLLSTSHVCWRSARACPICLSRFLVRAALALLLSGSLLRHGLSSDGHRFDPVGRWTLR